MTQRSRRDEARRLVAEAFGTGMLLAAVVGSGIVVSASTDQALALVAHAAVVGAALTALIAVLGPVSGAHLNPAVTVLLAWRRGLPWPRALRYIGAQLLGAVAGTAATNATFGQPVVAFATTPRDGAAMLASEAIATTGLLLVIVGLLHAGRDERIPAAVGTYIAAAIVFTASDAFANPAVTLARMVTDTWTGIAPPSVPLFVAGQFAAVAGVALLAGWWLPEHPRRIDKSLTRNAVRQESS